MKIFKRLSKLSSLALLLCLATPMQAADIDLATAKNVAKTFMAKQVTNGRLKASATSNLKLAKAEPSVFNPKAVDYYIFNADKSYVVVSGDDQAPEILMYGEEGTIDLNDIPPAMQWVLNKYKYQIDGLKAGTLKPNGYTPKATTAVPPLVTANWDQSSPYNNQCPTSGSSRTLTGCPATSLSMCYYKWKWPKTFPAVAAINGSSSGGVSAAALGERAADWDNIIDEYTGPTNYTSTSAQKTAVAWLMRYAGQSIPDYMYGTSASGANDPEIYQGVLNMGYTDAQLLTLTEIVSSGWGYSNSSQYYTDAQWNEWMLNELHQGNPIEYLAYDYSSYQLAGHAFNVFGCNTSGQYYVNWGWSGDSNGYCTLHNFTTNTGATGQSGSYVFNYGEAMIIGIRPPASALGPNIAVDPAELTFEGYVGETYTKTFTVTGNNLEGNITITKQGASNITVSPTTITAANAANGVQVTVTYKPTNAGNSNAVITLASTGAESVTLNVSATAAAKVPTINVDQTSLSFNANLSSTVSKTINVTGLFLTNNVTVTLNDQNGVFSVTPTTITAANAAAGVPVTVTFNSATEGNFTGSIVLASTGAQSKTVTLTASAAEGGNASDPYLNIAKYATIGEAGASVSGMSSIYKYTEYPSDACAWLTVSNYGAHQVDANQNWINCEGTAKSGSETWNATDVFLGSSSYFTGTAYYANWNEAYENYYVTNCSQVKQYSYNIQSSNYSSNIYPLKMEIYECTLNANGTLTEGTTMVDSKQSQQTNAAEVVTSAALDPSKIYKVRIYNDYSRLYEIAFKTDLNVTLPQTPINVQADPATTTAAISWTPGENNDGWNLRWREYSQDAGDEEVTFTENFENGLGNWTLINTDGDSYNWQTVDLTSNFSGQFTAKDGSYVAMSRSWISNSVGAVTPDQWLISPQVQDLGGTLKYYIMDDGNNYQENYRIYVSTSGKNVSDFVPVTDDMLSPNSTNWTEVTIDLSDYKGQAGYIAFRHYNCTDKDFMFIDAITLTGKQAAQWNYVNGVTSPYSITGLTANTTYEVQVQGKYESLLSDWTASTLFTTLAGTVYGDVNGDGEVNTVDVTILYNYLLNGDTENMVNGDQDGDGDITTVDITVVYNVLLGVNN